MWKKVWKYRTEILLIFLIIIAISVIAYNSLNPQQSSFIAKGILTILYPFHKITFYVTHQIENGFNFIFQLTQLNDENVQLKSELKVLKKKYDTLVEENIELKQLSKLSAFIDEHQYKYIPAYIIGVNPSPLSNLIIINKGEKDGIKINMCVTSEDGLIGKIKQVAPHSSNVLLLSDKKSIVSAIIQDTRERGIVIGKNLINEYTFIPENPASVLLKGQKIITSGLEGSIYPRGIPIGEIVNIQKAKYGIYFAEVKASADLNRLETVLVVTDTTANIEEKKVEDNSKQKD